VENIIAVDNASAVVEQYRQEGINIVLGDADSLPFPDGHFQAAFCCWLYEHLPDPKSALIELHRVLQSGGYAWVIVPTPHDMTAFYDDYTHLRPYTHRSLSQLAKAAGFARHTSRYLMYGRGINQILRYLGPKAAFGYLRLSDTVLRRVGIVNRESLDAGSLEVIKLSQMYCGPHPGSP
jgi:ubiquinone/menaquinone biosynthesis C-methylase UbiE